MRQSKARLNIVNTILQLKSLNLCEKNYCNQNEKDTEPGTTC